MKTSTIKGTYGSQQTPCLVFTLSCFGGTWYCVEGSKNINFTYEDLGDGVDVETVADDDTCTSSYPIECEEDLGIAVNDELDNEL